MNRQKRFLMLLLALLALAGVYAYWALPTQQRVAGEAPVGERLSARKPATTGSGLKLDQLQQSVPEFASVRRDIFNFKKAPPPPPPPAPKIEKPLPLPPPPPVVEVPVAAPSVAAARFDFLGQLSKGEKELLFLASGKEIYLVAAGDKFGDQQRFTLKSMNDQEIVIEQQGLGRPIVINLSEPASPGTPVYPGPSGRPLPRPATGLVPPAPPTLQPPPANSPPPAQRFRSFKRYRP